MACEQDFPDRHLNASVNCEDTANMPVEVMKCRGMGVLVGAWGIGGGPFVYPAHVGSPIGTEYTGKYFVMEVHYDNPDHKTGIIDSSGVRFFYTPTLRKYDAGVLTVGADVSSWMMIPPQQKAWRTQGYCPKTCTEKHLSNSTLPEKGIKIFSSFLHTHLSGRATYTQHVRNGVELPEIARDDNYDFNFQDIQFSPKEIHFKPGDDFVHSCIYGTMDRTKLTFGGDSTREEMCLNFIFYYPFIPKMPRYCTASSLQAGVAMMDKHYPNSGNASKWYNPIKGSHVIWTPEMTAEYRQKIDQETGVSQYSCLRNKSNIRFRDLLKDEYLDAKIKITTPLLAPKEECDVDSSATRHICYLFYQILIIPVIVLIW